MINKTIIEKTKENGFIRVKKISYKLVERVKPITAGKDTNDIKPVQLSFPFPDFNQDKTYNNGKPVVKVITKSS